MAAIIQDSDRMLMPYSRLKVLSVIIGFVVVMQFE